MNQNSAVTTMQMPPMAQVIEDSVRREKSWRWTMASTEAWVPSM